MKQSQRLELLKLDEVRGFSPSFVKALADKLAELKESDRLVEEYYGNLSYTKIAQSVIYHLAMQLWGYPPNDSPGGDYRNECGQIVKTAYEFLDAIRKDQ